MIATVGDRDGEVADHDTGVVGGAALASWRHRFGERCGEAEPIGELHQQEGPGVGDEPLAVRPDFYGLARRCVFTFRVSSWLGEWVVANRILKSQEDAPGGVPRVVTGGSGLGAGRMTQKEGG